MGICYSAGERVVPPARNQLCHKNLKTKIVTRLLTLSAAYGFGELLAVEKTGHPILKVECVFEGPQTTFAEEDDDDA